LQVERGDWRSVARDRKENPIPVARELAPAGLRSSPKTARRSSSGEDYQGLFKADDLNDAVFAMKCCVSPLFYRFYLLR